MTYSKKHKSMRQILAMVLAVALTFTSLYTSDLQVSAENDTVSVAISEITDSQSKLGENKAVWFTADGKTAVKAAAGSVSLEKSTAYTLVVAGTSDAASGVDSTITATIGGSSTYTTTDSDVTQGITIVVAPASQESNAKTVSVTPTISGLDSYETVHLTASPDVDIPLTSGSASELTVGTQYSLVVKNSSNQEVMGKVAKLTQIGDTPQADNTTTYTPGESDSAITIAVSTTSAETTTETVKVTPTINGLTNSNAVHLVASDVDIPLTSGSESADLTVGTAYSLVVKESSDASANEVSGKVATLTYIGSVQQDANVTTYTPTKGDSTITIAVSDAPAAASDVTVNVTLDSDSKTALGNNKIVLSASEQTDVEVTSSTTSVNLKPSKQYTLSVKTDDDAAVNTVTATVSGSATFTTTDDATQSITIVVAAVQAGEVTYVTKKGNVDISKGLKKGETYGDENVVKITVLADMGVKQANPNDVTKYDTVEGTDYYYYVQGTDNALGADGGKPKGAGAVTQGSAFVFEPVVNCTVALVTKSASKPYYFIEIDNDNNFVEKIESASGDALATGELKLVMEAGKKYQFYMDGSKPCVYALKYSYQAVSDYQSWDVGLTQGLVVGTEYGKTGLASLQVLEAMSYKSGGDNAVTIEGTEYQGYVQGSTDPKPGAGAACTQGAALVIKPTIDCSLSVVLNAKKNQDKQYYFVDITDSSNVVIIKNLVAVATGTLTLSDLKAGHTYQLYGKGTKLAYYALKLEAGTKPRAEWDTVAKPVIDKDNITVEDGTITVPFTMLINDDGADSVTVNMYNAEGTKMDSQITKANTEGTTGSVSFTPSATGKYIFEILASREDEANKKGEETAEVDFTLPLAATEILTIAGSGSAGKAGVALTWNAVPEATGYNIYYHTGNAEDAKLSVADVTEAVVSGLKKNEEYSFVVNAVRDEEEGPASVAKTCKALERVDTAWGFTSYGESTVAADDSKGTNSYKENKDEDGNLTSVQVWATNNGGKIVPASTDGLSFYYTKVPTNKNFVLTATVHADSWTYSNGQDGFGLLVTDRLGSGQTQFWNNSYMLGFTKVEFYWEEGQVASSSETKVNMHIGPGALQKVGVTKDNLANFTQNTADGTVSYTQAEAISKWFTTSTTPLDTSMATYGAGDYNIVANNQGGLSNVTSYEWNDFTVTIEKNNTGYFLKYVNRNGKTITKKYYDPDALSQLDEDYVYVGFFASRNATATFSDISFTTSDPATDDPAEDEPVTYYSPSYSITSASVSNTADYELKFATNWAGTLTIKDADGKEVIKNLEIPYKDETAKKIYAPTTYKLSDADSKAGYSLVTTISNKTCGTEFGKGMTLNVGENTYTVIFKPNKDYYPDDNELNQLKDYSTSNFTHTVTYKSYGLTGEKLYVAPDGKASGTGTKSSPLDIYTAIKYVQAGQSIILTEGTYSLSKTVRVERGISGTADAMIYLIADPDAASRVVLDFNGACAGMVFGGDYWYISGFDVTRSKDGSKGIQVSGSHNILEGLNTYMNGNTGIQISRLYGTDSYSDWPAYNTILNCNSYLNADAGYEDADGFAAKLTVGGGNVFEGCIAAYNADDGWDLFAKAETGNIGTVKINNCVTFKNGYVLLDDAGNLSLKGTNEHSAGNGNGFKMGGESLSGFHQLNNSYAFYNKAKGIDSNSCPDIQITNCVTFNNESYNVAFYTNTATQTNFGAKGLISYKTPEFLEQAGITKIENIAPVGNQTNQTFLPVVAKYTKLLDAELIKDYNALDSTKITKFKVTASWSDLTGSAFDTIKARAEALKLTDIEKEYCVKYMKYIAAYYTTYSAAADDDAKTALITDLKTSAYQIFGDHNYYIFAQQTVNPMTGVTVDATWFKNTTVTDFGQIVTRDEDGKIKFIDDFLQLTDVATQADSSLSNFGLTGKDYSEVKSDLNLPEKNPAETDTDGTNIVGGVGKEDTTSVVPGDSPASGLSMEGLWVAFVDYDAYGTGAYTYTGTAIKPEIRVYYDTTRLTTKDYSISYTNNVNAYVADAVDEKGKAIYDARKVPTIKITGKGNFEGFITQTFDIQPVNVGSGLVAAPSITKSYTGSEIKNVIPVLTYNGKKLTNKKDFTVAYNDKKAEKTDDNPNPLTPYKDASDEGYNITVTGTGNYTGTTNVKLYIIGKNTTKVDISKTKITQQNKSFFLSTASYVYNGKAIEPEVTVTYNDPKTGAQRTLTEDTDYKVSYANNTNVGTASIIVEGKGDFYGSKTLTFKITAVNVKDLVIRSSQYATAAATATTYKGQSIVFSDLELVLKSNNGTGDLETVLKEDKDYTITYTNNSKAGKASFTIKGKGNCTGTLKKTFTINAYDIELDEEGIVGGSIKDTDVVEVAYAASGAKPAISVTLGGIVLKQGTDYVVRYQGNTKVTNAATVTVTGKNGITGKLTKTFVVTKKDLADTEAPLTMTAADVVAKNSASAARTTVKIVDSNNKTVGSGEYNLSYYKTVETVDETTGNTKSELVEITGDKTFKPEAGTVITVKATAKPTSKKYVGELETTYKVTAIDIKSTSLKAFDWKYYTGSSVTLSEEDFEYTDAKTGSLVSRITYKGQSLWFGEDFEVVPGSYENNVKAGTARFTIRGITNKFGGTKILTFKINKKILNLAKATYTWDYESASLVVTLNNLQLTEDVDYTVDYSLLEKKGTVVVTGMGSYGGTKTVSLGKSMNLTKAVYSWDYTAKTLVVTLNGSKLTVTRDYTVDETNKATKGTVAVTAAGHYFGTKTVDVNQMINVAKAECSWDTTKKALVVSMSGNVLTQDTDYTVTNKLDAESKAVENVVVVTGTGAYIGTKEVDLTKLLTKISKATVLRTADVSTTITAANVATILSLSYNDTALVQDTDYIVDASAYATDGTVTIKGQGNYCDTVTVTVADLARSIAGAIVKKANGLAENADVSKNLVITLGTTTLTTSDYSVSWVDSKDKTELKITGKGSYGGTITVKVAELTEAPAATTSTTEATSI